MLEDIKNWDEVDLALKQMAEIDRSVSAEENELNKRIDEQKDLSNKKMQAPLAYKSELAKKIKAFCEQQKKKKLEFTDKKSRELVFGTVGYRASGNIKYILKADEIIKNLEDSKMDHCINVKKEIKKAALSGYTDEKLKDLGMQRSAKETFYYEVNLTEVKDNA